MNTVEPLMTMKLSVFGLSDPGLVRGKNEDSWSILKEHDFFVLADGMGGHQAGEIASKTAVELLCELVKDKFVQETVEDKNLPGKILHCVKEVNQMIFEHGSSHPDLRGMGTTLCCLHVQPNGYTCVHVGDSRIYLFRGGKLIQVTKDHSLMSEMLDKGTLQESGIPSFQYKHILTRAIGTELDVEPSVNLGEVLPGDLFLICSDGLTDMISDDVIEKTLTTFEDVEKTAHTLVDLAKEQGGNDNVTVVLIAIEDV